MTERDPVRVVYVAGTGRSGSTVLANLLGEAEGSVSVGELRYLWERGLVEGRLCGCGTPVVECPFWGEVLQRAFGDELPDPSQVVATLDGVVRMRNLPHLLRRDGGTAWLRERVGPLTDQLEALYAAVRDVSGADVVVDSSKLAPYAAVLGSIDGIDLRIVHLVRDPRAAAFSWLRHKEQPDRRTPGYMERRGAAKSTALWVSWNSAIERMWGSDPERYLRVRYEEFAAAPKAVTERIVRWSGLSTDALSDVFTDERTAVFSTAHTVAGNPSRMRTGPVTLRLDDEWVHGLRSRDRIVVTSGALPVLRRYGYPTRLPS